jgi:hypothetical protein
LPPLPPPFDRHYAIIFTPFAAAAATLMAATPPTVSPLFRHWLPLRFRRYYFIRFFILIYYAAFISSTFSPYYATPRSAIAAAAITRHYADLLPICRLLTPPPLPSLSPPIATPLFSFFAITPRLRHAFLYAAVRRHGCHHAAADAILPPCHAASATPIFAFIFIADFPMPIVTLLPLFCRHFADASLRDFR